MEYVVRAPGSCGELVQGRVNGKDILVTCPINRFSTAIAHIPPQMKHVPLPRKARTALDLTLDYLQEEEKFSVALSSSLPEGKGMASSSADIAAVCMATALACGRELTQAELMRIALTIEPSDAVFYPGIVMMDYLQGSFVTELGEIPPAVISVFDQGGYIDTVAFNARVDLRAIRERQSRQISDALDRVTRGLIDRDWRLIGEGATMSAFANQDIIYRRYLDDLAAIVRETNAYGVVVAHSGTVCGLISAPETAMEIKCKVRERCGREVAYFDTVELYNGGIDIKVRDKHQSSICSWR